MVEFICYSVPNLEETDCVVTEKDDENVTWIKTKEFEMMQNAKASEMLILYDRSSKTFYKDGKPFNVAGRKIFPRAFIPYVPELLTALERSGAKSICTQKDYQAITEWPKVIQPAHRKIFMFSFKEFKERWKEVAEVSEQVFLKTLNKSHKHYFLKTFGDIGKFIPEYKGCFFSKPPIMNISDDEMIMVSKIFKSIDDPENKMDCREYRAFVVDGKLLSLSRSYVDYETETPQEVKEFAKNLIAHANKQDFPKSYVVDLAEMEIDEKRVVDIVEFNPIVASGLEVGHHLVEDLSKSKSLND